MKKVNCDNMDDETFKDLAHAVVAWYEQLNHKLTPKDAMELAEELLGLIEADDEEQDEVEPQIVQKVKKLDVMKFGYTAQEALNHCGSIDGSSNMRGR
jgi:hypothetical protein